MLILHGDNLMASRQILTGKIKNFSGEVIRLDAKKINLTDLKQALETHSLFGQKKLVAIENLFSRQKSKEKEALTNYLKENKPPNLIVWEGKTIDGRALTSFKFAQIQKLVVPTVIFKLVDSLSPQNKKNSLSWLSQCLKSQPAEMIFYMICRQINLLIIAADLGSEGLEKMAPWQKMNLVRQAKNFSLNQLIDIYRQLLEIEYQQKTGRASLPLKSQLDLLITSL